MDNTTHLAYDSAGNMVRYTEANGTTQGGGSRFS
jgi:YD repeat-containing protein